MESSLGQSRAETFAKEWLAAWNSHNLDSIMDHYSPNVEFTSPFVC